MDAAGRAPLWGPLSTVGLPGWSLWVSEARCVIASPETLGPSNLFKLGVLRSGICVQGSPAKGCKGVSLWGRTGMLFCTT